MIGRTIQHYRIIDRLGQGGMGTVWRAEDLRLGRQVAIKVVSKELAADPQALDRFESEARLASSIAHPNIVSVYDVGSIDEGRFIAMELVDGDDLDTLLRTRRLRVDEIVEWTLQIGDALKAAHRVGIIHRDIKPANIYIARSGGYAKLGDFGIAKLREQASDPGATIGVGSTSGLVLGSPHYLSPEQAQGEAVDARTDVFSFAATLYELLTGRRAFNGASASDVIASVLRDDPVPPRRIRPEIPSALEAIVMKGLEKRCEYRYQHVDDLVADLRRLKRDLETGAARTESGVAPPAPARRRGIVVAMSMLVGIAAGALIVRTLVPTRSDASRAGQLYDLARITSETGLEDAPSWSPDGRSIVYTSDDGGHLGLRIRQVPGERSIRLGMPNVDEGQPVWSPDGNWIAFVSSRDHGGRFGIFLGSRPIEIFVAGQNGDLFVMPALGGTTRKLAADAYDPSWAPDGSRIAFRSIHDGQWRLYTVSIESGEVTPIKGVVPRALAPAWSPDGKWIAYIGGASAATGWDVYVVPAEGGTPIQVTRDRATVALAPAWSRDGRWIMYSSNRAGPLNLWRVLFGAVHASAAQPERLTTGIGEDVHASAAPDGHGIAYATVHTAPDIWTLDVGSRQLRQLTSETAVEDYPRVSPDGGRLLFYSDRTGTDEVWLMQLATREMTRVSRSGGTQNAWSPDGRQVAYGTSKGLQIVDLNSGRLRTMAPQFGVAYPAFSRDGRRIAFQGWNGREYRLYQVPADGGEPLQIATPQGEPGNPSWSPDGQTIYYQLDQFGRRNIWSIHLPTGQPRQLTQGDADDAHPDVSSDGQRLLFLRHHSDIYVMPVDGTRAPELLFAAREHGQLVEWPAWGPHDATVVFSLAQMTGDLFLLRNSIAGR